MPAATLPTLVGYGTAFPKHVLTQEFAAEDFIDVVFADLPQARRIARNAGVATRHTTVPTEPGEALAAARLGTGERMARWHDHAVDIGRTALHEALADTPPSALGSYVWVSCTGYSAPAPDLFLAEELGLSKTLRRTSVGHMGCFAAFNGLKVALDALVARPDEAALVHCTELCSLHLHETATVEQAVCLSLFGDASCAVILANRPEGQGTQFLTTRTETYYDTSGMMSWEVTDQGFRMGISPVVPFVLRENVDHFVERMLAQIGRRREEVTRWMIHPGGPKIIDLVGRALSISEEGLAPSRAVLSRYGNCSSPTVLLILGEIIASEPEPGELGVMLAFGPGLTIEGAVVSFCHDP